jgi:hypothetical protein
MAGIKNNLAKGFIEAQLVGLRSWHFQGPKSLDDFSSTWLFSQSNHRPKNNATQVRANNTGTSTNGPIVAASAWSEPTPHTAIATAIANSWNRCEYFFNIDQGEGFHVRNCCSPPWMPARQPYHIQISCLPFLIHGVSDKTRVRKRTTT